MQPASNSVLYNRRCDTMFANLIENSMTTKGNFCKLLWWTERKIEVLRSSKKYPSSYFIAVIYLFLRVSLYQELSHDHIRRTQDFFKGVLLIADKQKRKEKRSLISRRNNQTSKGTDWTSKKKVLTSRRNQITHRNARTSFKQSKMGVFQHQKHP